VEKSVFYSKREVYCDLLGIALKGNLIFDSLVGFQWFFIVNIFCWRHKENHVLRRYKSATTLIARKNSKRFAVLKSDKIGENLF